MSAYIGLCLHDGAFLSADSRRTDLLTDSPEAADVVKIISLSQSIFVATGGLGSVGEDCRNTLLAMLNGSETIDEIIIKARSIFKKAYSEFETQHPNQKKQPLYCIFGGYDFVRQTGFIKALKNDDGFISIFDITPGTESSFYFAGSKTARVTETASEEYAIQKMTKLHLNLDVWAFKSIEKISKIDNHVALPLLVYRVQKGQTFMRKYGKGDFPKGDFRFEVVFPIWKR